jgi:CubicO group peptidase (beta-lactamase class C family)
LLWWLNTKRGLWPGSPVTAFRAVGQGGNIIFIDPSHDLVVVWRWSGAQAQGFQKVVAAITS